VRTLHRVLPLVDAALCAVLLVLLLADLFWPGADIFLNGFVKVFLLVTCLLSSACGMLLVARRRRGQRRG